MLLIMGEMCLFSVNTVLKKQWKNFTKPFTLSRPAALWPTAGTCETPNRIKGALGNKAKGPIVRTKQTPNSFVLCSDQRRDDEYMER